MLSVLQVMHPSTEVPETAAERILVLAGTTVAVAGMFNKSTTRSLGLMLLGGAMVGLGLRFRNQSWRLAHGLIPPALPQNHGLAFEETLVFDCEPADAYSLLANVERFSEYLPRVLSVQAVGDRRSFWTVQGPAGETVDWESEIVADLPNEMLAWRTTPGSQVHHEGAIYFHGLDGGRTEVRFYMELHLPFGSLGERVARLLHEDPKEYVMEALDRLKGAAEMERTKQAGGK